MLVLLVEDDFNSRDIYGTILRAHGFDVLETDDGAASVGLARAHAPDVILMDMGVRGCDGWEATRRLKGQVETAGIPVVAITGHVLPEHRARAREAGCESFIAKPVEPLAIVVEVLRLLAPPSAA